MPIARRKERLRPRKRPLQARAQRTVDVVLKAAAQVFARRGYAGATTNHIAERAGVSIGTLYEYFPSKDALLVALMEAHIREGEAVLARAAAEIVGQPLTLAATIRHLATAMVELHGHERELHRVLFEEAPLPRQLRELLAEMEARITQRVELLLRSRPEVTVSDPALAAAVVVKTVEALTHNLVVHGDRDRHHDLAVYVEEIVRLVASYLTAPTAASEGRKLNDATADLLRAGLVAESARAAEKVARKGKRRLPLVKGRHPATAATEMTPQRTAEILLKQEASRHAETRR